MIGKNLEVINKLDTLCCVDGLSSGTKLIVIMEINEYTYKVVDLKTELGHNINKQELIKNTKEI